MDQSIRPRPPKIRIQPLRWGQYLHWSFIDPKTRAMVIAATPAALMEFPRGFRNVIGMPFPP